ncbi:MAG: cobalamin B12-binding domain-containing protein [Bacillota bacterium]
MGLLFHNLSAEYTLVADKVFKRQFDEDPRLLEEYDSERKKRMYQDILHNLSFLKMSLELNDERLFTDYSKWLLKLMIHLMPDLGEARIKAQMIHHYTLLKDTLESSLPKRSFHQVRLLLDNAIALSETYESDQEPSRLEGKYAHIKATYFRFLKERNAKKAIQYIKSLYEQGLPLEDIYVDILQEVMTEVGELWQRKEIEVDEEHYMTAITQTVLVQFYDKIFSSEPNGKTAIACSVGSELHEMGSRMISDLLAFHGYDTTHLGAGIPKKAILKRLIQEPADYLLLSVTMPQHLLECKAIVESVKAQIPGIKIAVGGRAFTMTDKLYSKWPIDFYAEDAKRLISQLEDDRHDR